MSISLKAIPGFADLGDGVLAAEKPALGVHLSKISQNATFGIVRTEFFYGRYKHGDVVPTPKSPIDGYNYAPSEVMFIWQPVNTASPTSGWTSFAGALWYANWFVDQATGTVTSEEWYGSGGQTSKTNDGIIGVFTVAQRQFGVLQMDAQPAYSDLADTGFYVDSPMKTSTLVQMNHNAKASVVDTEVLYMGEFINGQRVPQPISPVDGYQYSKAEIFYAKSWKWTTQGSSYVQPTPRDTYTWINRMVSTVDQDGLVSLEVDYMPHESNAITTNHGRIAVWAFCQRNGVNVTVLGTTIPWSQAGGINSSYAFTDSNFTDPISVSVAAGNKVSITYTKGLISTDKSSAPYKDGYGNQAGSPDGSDPGQYVTVPPHPGTCLGAFADVTGQLVADPFLVGDGVNIIAPASTTQLLLGVNAHGDRSVGAGSWLFHVSQQADPSTNIIDTTTRFTTGDGVMRSSGLRQVWDRNTEPNMGAAARNPEAPPLAIPPTYPNFSRQFTELDSALFSSGQPLPASVLGQINSNTREANNTPEIFSQTVNKNQVVALPVSPIDGYKYQRDECFYIWSWRVTDDFGYPGGQGTNTARNGDTIRIVVLISFIDSTGFVTASKWVAPDGKSARTNTNGIENGPVLDVLVICSRKSQRGSSFNPTGNSNSVSEGNNTPPDSDLGGFTVNGS